MDIFFTFLFLFLTLFAIKIYLIHQKTKEGFQFHRRKHNNQSTSPKNSTNSKKKQTEDEQSTGEQSTEEEQKQEKDVVVENMDIPDPLTQIDKVVNDFQNLRGVYERNAEGYPGSLGNVNGPIPEIPSIPELNINIPFPLDIITQPIEEIVNFFVDIVNTFIDFFNIIIDVIDTAIHYATCAFTLLVNFFTVPCFFWYILNLITVVIYLPFSFIFWLLGITDIIEEYIWGPIYIADEVFYNFSGFHFAHFPKSVIKGCYSCPAEFSVLDISSFSWIGDMFKEAFQFFPKN
jgi:hypothetical protein